jgi:hypothetical protein
MSAWDATFTSRSERTCFSCHDNQSGSHESWLNLVEGFFSKFARSVPTMRSSGFVPSATSSIRSATRPAKTRVPRLPPHRRSGSRPKGSRHQRLLDAHLVSGHQLAEGWIAAASTRSEIPIDSTSRAAARFRSSRSLTIARAVRG